MFSLPPADRRPLCRTASYSLPARSLRPHRVMTTSPADLPDAPNWVPPSWGLFGPGRSVLYTATLAACALSACATMPPGPTPEMTRAESAIEQAQRAGAAELAVEPLEAAQRNFSAAKLALSQRDAGRAAQLVDEAYVDARLAEITAQSAKSAMAAAEVDKSIRTLENETNRPRSP